MFSPCASQPLARGSPIILVAACSQIPGPERADYLFCLPLYASGRCPGAAWRACWRRARSAIPFLRKMTMTAMTIPAGIPSQVAMW
jgi:hypothetical protein